MIFSGLMLAVAPATHAQAIVQWGPDTNIVTGNPNGVGLANGVVIFSDTVARSPASGTNGYNGGTFYGGAESTYTGDTTTDPVRATGLGWWRILNGSSGANDAIDFGSYTRSGDTVTAAYIWKKEDFLNGFSSSASVSLTSVSATLYNTSPGIITGTARWLVNVNGQYYVSEGFGLTGAATTYSLNDLSSVSWYSYAPGTSLTAIGAQWVSPDFSDVSAVGLWMHLENTHATTASSAFGRIESFSATATAIPESSASSMVFAGLALVATIAACLRRNRTRAAK
ncbi:hypothetical protein OPIT5_05995 [Opitutaceae bacterium TAV5]|nr:hypothetical protein OPIT5_05995 [Opitutaceae bacterium TAV5]